MSKKILCSFLAIFVMSFSLIITNISATEVDFETTLDMQIFEKSFSINAKEQYADLYSLVNNVTVMVIKPGYDSKAEMSEKEIEKAIYSIYSYSASDFFDNGFTCEFDDNSLTGKYSIIVTLNKSDRSFFEANMTYTLRSEKFYEDMYKKFSSAISTDFKLAWQTYADVFDVSEYPYFNEIVEDCGTEFIFIRDKINAVEEYISINDIFEDIKSAVALYALFNKSESEAKEVTLKCGMVYSDIFDYSDDFEAFYKLFSSIKYATNNKAQIFDELKKICIMANMQDGKRKKSVKEIAYCLSAYGADLNVDIEYASKKNVSLNEVAAKIDSSNIYKYYKSSDWFNTIVDTIVNDRKNSNKNDSNVKGGGSFSGGYSSKNDTIINNDVITQPTDPAPIDEPKHIFSDIEDYDWALDAIEALKSQGVISGDGYGRFEPERYITREEFVKMVCSAFSIYETPSDITKFTDVSVEAWYYPYIAVAKSTGLIKGMSESRFGIGERITREDMTCIMLNLLHYKGINPVARYGSFVDHEDISDYAQSAVSACYEIGLINGFDGNMFKPKDYTTRAQSAVVVYRMQKYIDDLNGGK